MAGNPQRLEDKVAIITGAGGAIGAAIARLFVDLGASAMLTDRDGAKLDETARSLEGDKCATAVGDSADEAAMQAVIAATLERFGKLDILVANAGIEGALKPLHQLSRERCGHGERVHVLSL